MDARRPVCTQRQLARGGGSGSFVETRSESGGKLNPEFEVVAPIGRCRINCQATRVSIAVVVYSVQSIKSLLQDNLLSFSLRGRKNTGGQGRVSFNWRSGSFVTQYRSSSAREISARRVPPNFGSKRDHRNLISHWLCSSLVERWGYYYRAPRLSESRGGIEGRHGGEPQTSIPGVPGKIVQQHSILCPQQPYGGSRAIGLPVFLCTIGLRGYCRGIRNDNPISPPPSLPKQMNINFSPNQNHFPWSLESPTAPCGDEISKILQTDLTNLTQVYQCEIQVMQT